MVKTYCGFDLETTGFKKYEGDTIFAYVITHWNGESNVYRLDGDVHEYNNNWQILQDFFNDTTIGKIAHNYIFELSWLRSQGIHVPEETEWHDTMIQSQMLNNVRKSHKLEWLARAVFNYPDSIDAVVKRLASKHATAYKKKNKGARLNLSGYHLVDHKIMTEYQIADGERTVLLHMHFIKELMKDKPLYADYLHEIELVKTSVRMMEAGIKLDYGQINTIEKSLERKLRINRTKLRKITKKNINFNSSQELSKFIQNDLGIKLSKKTAKGAVSVDKEVITDFKDRGVHPIFDIVLVERAYLKGLSMLKSYRELVTPQTGMIHPNLRTNKAVTGRQACSEPNLQNIAKEMSSRTLYGVPARKGFRANPGDALFLLDYAGIEFRLIVGACGEEEFIEIMHKGGDVHDTASAKLYGENWDEINQLMESPNGVSIPRWLQKLELYNKNGASFKQVRKNMREGSKVFEFGIAYGGGYDKITAQLMGLNNKQKKFGDRAFRDAWPKITNFTNDKIKEIKKIGYITTAFGRKLRTPPGLAYTASNYNVQGDAAGILKRAETRIDGYCLYELDNKVKQRITVHDEIILSYPRSLWSKKEIILPEIYRCMTEHPEIKVPLEVEAKMTFTNWAAAKDFKL